MKKIVKGSTIRILEGASKDQVLKNAAQVKDADFVEWRIDGYEDTFEIQNMPEAVKAVKEAVSPAGLIVAYRDRIFGGVKPTSFMYYTRLNDIAEKEGADYVNVSLFEDTDPTVANLSNARRYGAGSVISFVNNNYLPLNKFIKIKMEELIKFDADAVEYVSWVYNEKDEVTMMQAVEEFKAEHPDTVLIISEIDLEGKETKRVF